MEDLVAAAELFVTGGIAEAKTAKTQITATLTPQFFADISQPEKATAIEQLMKVFRTAVDDVKVLVLTCVKRYFEGDLWDACLNAKHSSNSELVGLVVDCMLDETSSILTAGVQAAAPMVKALTKSPPSAHVEQLCSRFENFGESVLALSRLFDDKKQIEVNTSMVLFASQKTSLVERLFAMMSEDSDDPLGWITLLNAADIVCSVLGLQKMPADVAKKVTELLAEGAADINAILMKPFLLKFVGSVASNHPANTAALPQPWLDAVVRGLTEEEADSAFESLGGVLNTEAGLKRLDIQAISKLVEEVFGGSNRSLQQSALTALGCFVQVPETKERSEAIEVVLPKSLLLGSLWSLRSNGDAEVRLRLWELVLGLLVNSPPHRKMLGPSVASHLCGTAPFEDAPNVRQLQLECLRLLLSEMAMRAFHEKMATELAKGLYRQGNDALVTVGDDVE